MVKADRPPANGFVRAARKIYNPVGFSKGYNFILWFIFSGALMGFVLARFYYLDYNSVFCPQDDANAGPGECFNYYKYAHEKAGIIIHLAGILPAGFLACFQFVPAIRHKAMILHRISGYLVILLSIVATIGTLLIARHAFGGGIDIQIAVGFMSILFVGSLILAYINIKRLQIEQHRAWMLRAWFYATSIITLRIIEIISTTIVSSMAGYYVARPCEQILYTFHGNQTATMLRYPECAAFFTGENLDQHAAVKAILGGGTAIEAAAALGITFGGSGWLALALHAIGVEIYLRLTPAEHERLRNVSYQRQLEAGMENPGRAGITADRLGDAAEWIPVSQREHQKPEGVKLMDIVDGSEPLPYDNSNARTWQQAGAGHGEEEVVLRQGF